MEKWKDEQDISLFKVTRQEINKDLQDFDISPLKSHSKSSTHLCSERSCKIACVNEMVKNITKKIERHTNVLLEKMCVETISFKKKAKNFDKLWV